MDYKSAGVDMDEGDRFADFIRNMPSRAVDKGIGGFAGGLSIKAAASMRDPVLLSTTDGVGTKILVARKTGRWDTIGIDLVAMNVNDLIVCGCRPLNFLDYIACGRVDSVKLQAVIKGIVLGCEEADCVLTGGETAEMPDLYAQDDIDLAGFCTGIVDRADMLPRLADMAEGDVILGLPSSGVHSNGYSLARKCVRDDDELAWDQLLTPTRIYVRELGKLIDTGRVLAAAHITGSGLEGNFPRVLPPGLSGDFSWDWPRPPIFDTIAKGGSVPEAEMRRVFNLGVGMAFVVKARDADEVLAYAAGEGIEAFRMGRLVRG
ncbi:MAG: phosphoribosylformylglycinamidine cyclo-ligase [Spirochaetota bacterium]